LLSPWRRWHEEPGQRDEFETKHDGHGARMRLGWVVLTLAWPLLNNEPHQALQGEGATDMA
jgi:hypothetical protein